MKPDAVGALLPRHTAGAGKPVSPAKGEAFARILSQTVGEVAASGVRFSAHAMDRMSRRDIQLTALQESRLSSGLQSLASKGSRDGLVVLDDNRFVVSVSNKTIITALTSKDRDVYTNIDGVVFA